MSLPKYIAECCAPAGSTIKQVMRDGIKVWAAIKDKTDLAVAESIDTLAAKLEADARTIPLVSHSPETHLFGGTCMVEFGANRGEFVLKQGTTTAYLVWMGPGRRWVATTANGDRLRYKRDFKLDWTEQDRQHPALKAWLAHCA